MHETVEKIRFDAELDAHFVVLAVKREDWAVFV
jgi:hypothetical protein